jgi:tetratricopeptide (TPR) repeat protein
VELTPEQALQQGVAAHKEGKLQEAERLYRAILQSQPKHPDANHNLGVLALSVNQAQAALPFFQTAVDANPNIEQFWLSYIEALIAVGQIETAKQALKKGKKKGVAREKLKALKQKLMSLKAGGNPVQVPDQAENNSIQARTQAENQKLLNYYQNGQFGDAEKLALSITEQFPENQFAWKVLGAVLVKSGRNSEAVNANQTAVALSPQDAEAHSNLGGALKVLGRLDEAEASYAQAIALKPDFAEALYNLGVMHHELGRLEEAEANYTQAIASKPNYAQAHSNLGVTLKELNRLEESEASCRQAIELKHDYAEAHSNLGVTLKERGRLEEAEASFRRAIVLKPDFAEALYNLGATLQLRGRIVEAEASFKQAIALAPDNAEAHSNLGNIHQELGRLEQAEASYRHAIALKPDYAEAHSNMGTLLHELARLGEAETSLRQAIALKPDLAEAHNNLGNIHQELGRLEQAEASYRQAIALQPDYAEAHRHLTLVKKFDSRDKQYLKMQELYLDENISEEERCHINFGLAKACEDLGDYEQAFSHYSKGNALRKKRLNYDINQDIELFKQLKSSYPGIEKNALKVDNLANRPMPIFIVGMPRSGTTLVEQIISSHSQVTGAGELRLAAQFGEAIARGFSDSNTEALLSFRDKYLTRLQHMSNGNLIVTDKMPNNFRIIGLLAAAFPEAKIVHVKRNPAAVCWANYKQYFSSKNLGYCYDLDDVINYYRMYTNLMEFWERSLSKRIYSLDYELLTVSQEEETHQVIEYLGLGWDEKCLSPQDNTRSVATASNMQVREKVYQGSSQQWKKYQPFLNGRLDDFENSL